MRDGQRVSYLGDNGRVVSSSSQYAHVLFTTGSNKDQILLVDVYDLEPLGKQSSLVEDDLIDSLDVGGLASLATREIFDQEGSLGILTAMADAGHLTAFQDIADEAILLIESRLRHDRSFQSITSSLDDDESDLIIKAAAALILRDSL